MRAALAEYKSKAVVSEAGVDQERVKAAEASIAEIDRITQSLLPSQQPQPVQPELQPNAAPQPQGPPLRLASDEVQAELSPPEPSLKQGHKGFLKEAGTAAPQPLPASKVDQEIAEAVAEVPKIKDEAESDALPSGTVFIDPEGNRRRKP